MKPSSATTGFFQPAPTVLPSYSDPTSKQSSSSSSSDTTLSRLLSLYLPTPLPSHISSDLHQFARLVLDPATLSHTTDAELNAPSLHPLTTFGAPNTLTPLRTGEGWRALTRIGQEEGIVGLAFKEQQSTTGNAEKSINARVYQFAKLLLWQGSAGMVTCPAAMTDGAAVLLGRHLDGDGDERKAKIFREARRRLTARDHKLAWTSGQWMTERSGGSDVSGTETVASLLKVEEQRRGDRSDIDKDGMPLGPYSITGYKFFSSATDSNCAILLAKTSPQLPPSVFFAPMRLSDGSLNGVRIVRLKKKLGTKPVPTAELELRGMRAWMVGEEGKGVKEISAILNITRLHTGVANLGYWDRGLAVARAYAQVRTIRGGRLLGEDALHCRWMAGEVVKYRAAATLVFFGAALLGVAEKGSAVEQKSFAGEIDLVPSDPASVELLLRVVTPLLKAQTTLASTAGLRACMESLGGVGYLENHESPELNIARLFRDSAVSSIWEGTTSVMGEDLLKVLNRGKEGNKAISVLAEWIYGVWVKVGKELPDLEGKVKGAWVHLRTLIEHAQGEELRVQARDVLEKMEGIVCAILLVSEAVRTGRDIEAEVARRWCDERLSGHGEEGTRKEKDWKEICSIDRKIFLGDEVEVEAEGPKAKI